MHIMHLMLRAAAVQQAAALHAAGVHHAGALHPNYIQPLVSGLTPTPEETAWAGKAVEEYDRLPGIGESIGTFEGKVIDKYEYNMAKRTLDWGAACAAKDSHKAGALSRCQSQS